MNHQQKEAWGAAQGGQILGTGVQYAGLGSADANQQDARGVQQSINRLRTAVGEIGMCVDGLRQRLEPVMAPQQPETANAVGTVAIPSRCAMSEEINATATDLLHMVDAMRSYMKRLEI